MEDEAGKREFMICSVGMEELTVIKIRGLLAHSTNT
jgi:hypothetical protein